MRIRLLHGAWQEIFTLPMWKSKLRDLLYQMECDPSEIRAQIEDSPGMRCLEDKTLAGNAYWLNHLAKMIMTTDDAHRAAFKGLLDFYGVQRVETLVEWLYGSVPMVRVHSASDMREIAVKYGCAAGFDEITADPYAPDVLDRVNALFRIRCGGVIADGYFCECSEYQPPEKLEVNWIPADVPFSMVCGVMGDDSTKCVLQFPCPSETIDQLRLAHAGKLIVYSDYQTLLPGLELASAVKDLHQLNELAGIVSEMDHEQFRSFRRQLDRQYAKDLPQFLACAESIITQREQQFGMEGMQ